MKNKLRDINYEERYVAFLDVLGFKDLVKSNKNDKINLYLKTIEKAIDFLKKVKIKNNLELGYIVISDSIIISVKKSTITNENIEILKHLCIAIGFLQSILACNDIWLRGAISSGEAYFNDEKHQVIGKAYIDAYLLEEKQVSNPQVILDNKIIKELNANNSNDLIDLINNKYNGYLKFNNCGKTILYNWKKENYIEKDFPLFIDFLALQFNPSEATSEINMIQMKEEIVKNIENNIYTNTALYSKYKWLANYLISIIENNESLEDNPFKIRLMKL